MKRGLTRRDFVKTGAVAGAAAAASTTAKRAKAAPEGPVVIVPGPTKPVVIASANGNKFKNSGPRTCVAEAFLRMTKGADVLDALIAGVNIVELDPEDDSVGYGGLPNADGAVQLDSCCMHGPKRRAGGVAALEGVRTPSNVAKAVMEMTDHHLIVGTGAQTFARNMGFKIEPDLNTDKSRGVWLEWKRRTDPSHYLDPAKRTEAGDTVRKQMIAEGLLDLPRVHGTINCNGMNTRGEICGVTTTSGLAFKVPGRVGDSPILGAGLWVDTEVGAAGSTGRGEANLYGLSSFLIVELMRQGKHPKDAALEALRRIQNHTVEKRLLNSHGLPNFYVTFYALSKKGDFAGVSMYASRAGKPVTYAVCTERGPETRACDALLGDMPKE
jgi:N4-(beta-N-acetylglucosaminyl)-L-asparaginase